MLREKTHELHALEHWLKEILQEDVFGEASRTEEAVKNRNDLEKRAQVGRVCFEPLVDQVATHSPQLAKLLKQVFVKQDELLKETLAAYRKQNRSTDTLAHHMKGLIGFSERQLKRSQYKTQQATRRAHQAKEDLDSKMISMRILEAEHGQLRQSASESATLLKKITERSEEEVEAYVTNSSEKRLDEAVSNLEMERRRKLKGIQDLDNIIASMELDHIRSMDLKAQKARVPTTEASTEVDESMEERNMLFQLCRARGKTAQGEEEREPPSKTLKKWRVGWHLPFPLRDQMSFFQTNKRCLPLQQLLRLIISIYQLRQARIEEDNKPTSPSSRTKTPTSPGPRKGKNASGKFSPLSKQQQQQESGNINVGSISDKMMIAPSSTQTLHRATYLFLSKTYGLAKLTDWHVTELVNSIHEFRDSSRRVALFGALLGIHSFKAANILDDEESNDAGKDLDNNRRAKFAERKLKTNRLHDSLATMYTDFSKEEKWCTLFLIDILDHLSIGGEFTASQCSSEDGRVLITRNFAFQIVNKIVADWRMGNSGETIRSVSDIKEILEQRSGGKKGRRKSSASELGINSGEEEKDEPIVRIDLDDFMFVMAKRWMIHEVAWRKRLLHVFTQHCTLMRFVQGIVIPCRSFDDDLEGKKNALMSIRSKAQGYFGTMSYDQFKDALKEFGVTTNKRQTSKLFKDACAMMVKAREVRSEAVWLKATSQQPEDQGRIFYANQLNNERVWDKRPLFDTEVDELMSANPEEEIDLDAFIQSSMVNRFDTGIL